MISMGVYCIFTINDKCGIPCIVMALRWLKLNKLEQYLDIPVKFNKKQQKMFFSRKSKF